MHVRLSLKSCREGCFLRGSCRTFRAATGPAWAHAVFRRSVYAPQEGVIGHPSGDSCPARHICHAHAAASDENVDASVLQPQCTLPFQAVFDEAKLNTHAASWAGSAPMVAVVGAGIIGLSTALQLRRRFPHIRVEIISEGWHDTSTSRGSGGYWEPYQIVGTPDELINRWGASTFAHLTSLLWSDCAPRAGVQLVAAHALYTTDTAPTSPSWAHIVHNFKTLGQEDVAKLGIPGAFKSGWAFQSLVADQSHYLPWLESELKAEGGVVVSFGKVPDLDALGGRGYAVIFNCTGMGSECLAQDTLCFPIRGQVRRVKAPWVKGCWFFDDANYIIPQLDCIVVGGTQQRGDYNREPTAADAEQIWRVATAAMPGLASAEIMGDWAGLRPARSGGVRVEMTEETLGQDTRSTPVVHNYGHGGSGVTLHWGCVEDAIALVAARLEACVL